MIADMRRYSNSLGAAMLMLQLTLRSSKFAKGPITFLNACATPTPQ
jgi:hypothetical protein